MDGFVAGVCVCVRQADKRWEEEGHLDAAWVRVELQDDNDNDPHLATSLVNLTLSETTPLGHSLASFTASDLDQVRPQHSVDIFLSLWPVETSHGLCNAMTRCACEVNSAI